MNTRTLFVVTIIGLLFVVSSESAKPNKWRKAKEVKEETKAEAPVAEAPMAEEKIVFAPHAPKLVWPCNLKVLTAFDKCKMECERQREKEGLVSYVEQLKAELAAAERVIAQQEAAAAEGHSENSQNRNIVRSV